MTAATLFHGGNLITVDSQFSRAEAVLVHGDRILAVGSTDRLRAAAPSGTRTIDLEGRTLLPGFIDTHGHVALFGLDELKVSLTGATTRQEILGRLAGAVASAKPGAWVVAMPIGDPPYFLNANALREAGVVPSLQELDAIAPENPVYIQAPTNRVPNFAVLNSAALRASGIDANTHISPHSRVEVKDGKPTGILEGAMQPIYNADPLYQRVETAAPRAGYAETLEGIARLAPKFAAAGTTTLLEAHLTEPEELRAYIELMEAGRLPLRIFYTFEIDGRQSLPEIERYLRTVRFAADGGFGNARVKVVGVSVGLDGPYWHGAAYNDAPYPGPFGSIVNPGPLVPPEHYRQILQLAARMGFRIHAEAAGRGSIGLALEAFAAIDRVAPIRDKRHVLEHCEFPTKAHIAECRRLGIAPTTSTNFIWGKGAEVYQQRLGGAYADVAIPLRDWLDGGVPVSQSTDWGPHEALFTLWQALARQSGLTGKRVGPGQDITREEALRCSTWNGAWALRMEHELGSIEPGKKADLVVLDGDPLTCPEAAIKDLQVQMTMIDGEWVHGAP